MTHHPSIHQFQTAAPVSRRHDPEDQKLQALPAPAALIRRVAPSNLLTHAFPCRKGQAVALIAFQHEPGYAIFPMALQDRSGLFPFVAGWGVEETDDPILPLMLVPIQKPRTIREAIEAAEQWLRVAVDGLPIKSRRQ